MSTVLKELTEAPVFYFDSEQNGSLCANEFAFDQQYVSVLELSHKICYSFNSFLFLSLNILSVLKRVPTYLLYYYLSF